MLQADLSTTDQVPSVSDQFDSKLTVVAYKYEKFSKITDKCTEGIDANRASVDTLDQTFIGQ